MIDTHVAGRPADIRGAAGYLLDRLAPGVTVMADTVVDQRTTLQRGWEGEAGSAFTSRATILGRAGDDVAAAVDAMGRQIEALASILDVVQLGMAGVRAEAAASGLRLQGEVILPPVQGPMPVDSAQETAQRDQTAAYVRARIRRDELANQWAGALTETTDFLERNAAEIAQVTADLLVAGYSAALLSRTAEVMSAQAAEKRAEAKRLARYADELTDAMRSGRLNISTGGFYDHLDDLMGGSTQAADEAADAAGAAKNPRLPGGLARGLGVLGPIAAGYGVYGDISSGESTEQAVVSQGGGLLGGIVAGGLTGAGIGSLGFPIAGTIVGGVAGAAAGAFADSAIDDHYEDQAAEDAAAEAQHDEERLQQMLNVSEGLPLYSTPGSDQPMAPFDWWDR